MRQMNRQEKWIVVVKGVNGSRWLAVSRQLHSCSGKFVRFTRSCRNCRLTGQIRCVSHTWLKGLLRRAIYRVRTKKSFDTQLTSQLTLFLSTVSQRVALQVFLVSNEVKSFRSCNSFLGTAADMSVKSSAVEAGLPTNLRQRHVATTKVVISEEGRAMDKRLDKHEGYNI